MKRTLWHFLTAAVAAVLPGMTGPVAVDVAPAPVPEAIKPAPEAVQLRRAEIRHDERVLDEHEDDPAPEVEVIASHLATRPTLSDASRVIAAPVPAPEVAPLARRSLGRPRVRAPDARA